MIANLWYRFLAWLGDPNVTKYYECGACGAQLESKEHAVAHLQIVHPGKSFVID